MESKTIHVYRKQAVLQSDCLHTVHEMAKDEARHGCGFKGLLERYFK